MNKLDINHLMTIRMALQREIDITGQHMMTAPESEYWRAINISAMESLALLHAVHGLHALTIEELIDYEREQSIGVIDIGGEASS